MSAAAARIFTLPAVATSAGLEYRFVVTTAGANTITIRAASACIIGKLMYGATTVQDAVNATASTDIVLAINQLVGTWVHLLCDGTNWFCDGNSTIAAGFTVV